LLVKARACSLLYPKGAARKSLGQHALSSGPNREYQQRQDDPAHRRRSGARRADSALNRGGAATRYRLTKGRRAAATPWTGTLIGGGTGPPARTRPMPGEAWLCALALHGKQQSASSVARSRFQAKPKANTVQGSPGEVCCSSLR